MGDNRSDPICEFRATFDEALAVVTFASNPGELSAVQMERVLDIEERKRRQVEAHLKEGKRWLPEQTSSRPSGSKGVGVTRVEPKGGYDDMHDDGDGDDGE